MRKQKTIMGIFAVCLATVSLACGVLATQASAAEATVSNSTVSQYNLASENWEELLGVTSGSSTAATGSGAQTESRTELTVSEESEITGFFAGNASSDGGASKLLIIAIIAFALGAIGVVWFIYSQFIYKAKLRRKMEGSESDPLSPDYDLDETPMELDLSEKPTPTDVAKAGEEPTKIFQTPEKDKQEDGQPATSLTKEDEERLKQVDWDDFFKNN